MKPEIPPDKLADWKDQMRRYQTVVVPVEDFAVILRVLENNTHAGCLCPHCNPQP